MKKILILFIVVSLFGIINVNAEEKYNILIDENNNFTLTNQSNNSITDSSIAKYENNTLTLGDNNYFNQINIKTDATITSNNKGVYINELMTKTGNNLLPVNIVINNLKVNENDTYILKISIGGHLIVNSSSLNSSGDYEITDYLYITDSNIKTSKMINSRGSDEDGNAIKIINSTVSYGGQLYTQSGGNYIKDSNISGSSLYSRGEFHIENSNVTCEYLTQQSENKYRTIIKNSDIKIMQDNRGRQAYIVSGDVIIEDSIFEAGSFYLSPKGGDLIINNSTLNLIKDSFSSGSITTNGIIKTNNSVLDSGWIWSNELIIESSELITGDIYINQPSEDEIDKVKLNAKNSKINIYNTSSTLHGNVVFDNCELDIQKLIHAYQNMTVKNSRGTFSGIIMADKDFIIKDSVLKITNETGFSKDYLPLTVKQSLKINNSNIVIDNVENEKKAAGIQGDLILDDEIVPIDNKKARLQLKLIEDDSAERSVCSSCYDANRPIYTFVYDNNEFSKYVKLATTKKATFKVKNGSWLDGTDGDIVIDYIYGEKINVEDLPDKVQELFKSNMGSWSMDLNNLDTTKNLEIVFKYNLINPNTFRSYYIILLIIIPISIVVIKRFNSLNKKKLVN